MLRALWGFLFGRPSRQRNTWRLIGTNADTRRIPAWIARQSGSHGHTFFESITLERGDTFLKGKRFRYRIWTNGDGVSFKVYRRRR